MDQFDELLGSPSTQPAAATQGPAMAADMSIDRLLDDGHAMDSLLGESIPLPLSGNTPETAMNKSPLSAQDRIKLSLGNQAGNIEYLKKKFQDVKPIIGKDGQPTTDIAIKDQGTWFRVDPVNGDIKDPWERTKEYLQDAAEYAPEALGIGIAVAADTATAGMALPASAAIAGGAAAAVRTSLGRIVGTYDATPAEQAWDIGFESLLNAAGAKVLAGVKPSAKWAANKLDDLALAFKDTIEPWVPGAAKSVAQNVADSPKNVFKKVFSSFSVGESNFDTMLENTQAVKSAMKSLPGDIRAYHDEAVKQQTQVIQKIAEDSRKVLSNIYGSLRNQALARIPSNFSVNLEEPVYQAYSKAIGNGLAKLQVGGKELSGREAMEYLGKTGARGARLRLLSPDEMMQSMQGGANIGEGLGALASDKEAYGVFKEFYDALGKFTGGQNRSGTEGARALLDFKKIATDLSYKLKNSESAQNTPALQSLINEAKVSMDNAVFQKFKEHGSGDLFTRLNSTYNELSDKFAPLLKAKQAYDAPGGTLKVYENLVNNFLARPGKNISTRYAIDDAIAAADGNGLKGMAQELINQKKQIQIMEAAKAFNPLSSSDFKSGSIMNMGNIAGAAALMTKNPWMIGAFVGAKALQSPGVSSAAISTVQGLAKSQQFLSKMGKRELDAFLSSPEAMTTFMTGALQAPLVRAKAEQGLNAMIGQHLSGPQQ